MSREKDLRKEAREKVAIAMDNPKNTRGVIVIMGEFGANLNTYFMRDYNDLSIEDFEIFEEKVLSMFDKIKAGYKNAN